MKRWIFGGLFCASGVLASTAFADNYDDTGGFYVSGLADYTFLDKRRVSRDDIGEQFGLGYNLPGNFALELNYQFGSFAYRALGEREKLDAITGDVIYKLTPPTQLFRPYVLFGGGEISDNIGRAEPSIDGWAAEGGVGGLLGLGPQNTATRVQLRLEVKYRYELQQGIPLIPHNPGDIIAGLGFNLTFGAPTPPPPPVAKAAPVVEEPPPPPPADSDQDGVPDSIDRCPNTPHGDKVDAYGCTIKQEIRLPGVTFAFNSAELTPESDTVLGYAVATLKAHPELVVEVDGHTDSVGTDKYNIGLSQRRAESVLAYLQAHGVTNTLTAKGYGKADPIEDNRTAEGRLANRRVALKVLSGL